MRRIFVAASLILFVAALSLHAQTTGEIIGKITDEQGGALPGVTVEVKGPALQGSRSNVTDTKGDYRLVLLPPGTYTLTATLAGFAQVQRTVTVSLAKTATELVTLRPSTSAEVMVTGEAPVVDTTSTEVGSNFDSRQIRTLPTGRNYASVVLVAPGVTTQASNTGQFSNTIAIYGSSGLENSYIIDGADTSGVEYGAQGKELNFEFIQEVDVKTGGYQAEFGRSTGGIINVITKSGGNEFHGDVFGYYNANSLQADNRHPDENLYGTNLGFSQYDWGLDAGGYIWKDRIWFFGAYDRVKNTQTNALSSGPLVGEEFASDTVRNLGSGKLTLMVNSANTLVGSFFQDPGTTTGAINDGAHTLNGEPSTFLGRTDLGGQDWGARYNGIFGSSWVATAQFAAHSERNSVGPSTETGQDIQFIDQFNNNFASGGFGLIQHKDFQRYLYGGSLTKYLTGHELKAGLEYERQTATVTKRYSGAEGGGQQVTLVQIPGYTGPQVYRHFYWTTPTASLPDDVPTSQLNATPEHKMLSAYLQDSWQVLSNLTLNLGVRWDHQKIYDSLGTEQINLNDDFAPRVGIVWDPSKDHRTKVYGSFGYFYEQIPMDLVIRSYSFERQPRIFNFDPTSTVPSEEAAELAGSSNAILGGFTEPSDPNIKGQYVREFLLGGEREVMQNLGVGVKYIYRNYGRVIEDFVCSDAADYCIGNPGEGIMSTLFDFNYVGGYPAPKAQRIFRGVQFDVTKRFADNWSLVASYLWSRIDGNYDGGFAPYTQPRGTADPNISASYDYFDFFTNGQDLTRITNTGRLSNDRTHQIKVYGTYVAPFGLNVGLSSYFRTGTPLTRLGYSIYYDRYEFFLTRRGDEGRVPSDYEMDLHLGYPFQIGPVTVNALVDIFSLLNVQRSTFLEEAYNVGQFQDANYVCGSDASNPDEALCNPYYGRPLARTSPRSVRFGLRVSF